MLRLKTLLWNSEYLCWSYPIAVDYHHGYYPEGTTPPVSKITNFKLRYLVRRMVCERVFGPNLLAFFNKPYFYYFHFVKTLNTISTCQPNTLLPLQTFSKSLNPPYYFDISGPTTSSRDNKALQVFTLLRFFLLQLLRECCPHFLQSLAMEYQAMK